MKLYALVLTIALAAVAATAWSPSRDSPPGRLHRVVVGEKEGFVDDAGEWVIRPRFDHVGPFSEGLAVAKGGNGRYGYIDDSGSFVIAPGYYDAFAFSEGFGDVRTTNTSWETPPNQVNFIGSDGQILELPTGVRYRVVREFNDGVASVEMLGGVSFIDREGRTLFGTPYEDQSSPADTDPYFFSEGKSCVPMEHKTEHTAFGLPIERVFFGYADRNGEAVIPPVFRSCGTFSEGLAPVAWRGAFDGAENDLGYIDINRWGFVDASGATVIAPSFTYARPFSEGLAAVIVNALDGSDDRYGFVDRTGRFVVEPHYEFVTDFHDGAAAVQSGELWGYVNREGRVVIPPAFDDADEFENGSALVEVSGRHARIWPDGTYLWKEAGFIEP